MMSQVNMTSVCACAGTMGMGDGGSGYGGGSVDLLVGGGGEAKVMGIIIEGMGKYKRVFKWLVLWLD